MNNPLNKLFADILSENNYPYSLKQQLIDYLSDETRKYYNLLNYRMKNGELPENIELNILREKIKEDMVNLKSVIMVKFIGDQEARPAAVVFDFDKEGIQRKIDELKNNPNVEYILGNRRYK